MNNRTKTKNAYKNGYKQGMNDGVMKMANKLKYVFRNLTAQDLILLEIVFKENEASKIIYEQIFDNTAKEILGENYDNRRTSRNT